MEIYSKWFENLIQREGIEWNESIRVQGSGKRSGPTTWFAEVILEFSPSDRLEIVNLLDPVLAQIAQENGWFDFIVFGVLDVMLVSALEPIKNFRLNIHHINYNEIESNRIAFRLAGRDAAMKAMDLIKHRPLK